jgi:cell wall-associated NlpC family hydrolase
MPPIILTLLLLLLSPPLSQAASTASYAVARLPTPVFSTPDIGGIFAANAEKALRLDRCNQMRELEFVALPGTVFTIEETLEKKLSRVYRVTTADYPYPTKKGYFIDSRFVDPVAIKPAERARTLPARETVIARLLAAQGRRYVWGGNVREGIPELLDFYPPPPGGKATAEILARWQLEGVDCSGLLYEATGGFTPRNTSALITFGTAVSIAGLTADQIAARLEPLDLIVWDGHVMIVIDRARVIESRLNCSEKIGVVVSPLKAALARVMGKRLPVNDYRDSVQSKSKKFVVRRWYQYLTN